MLFPFAVPYPEAPASGYWDQVTSTIDWCEENYVVTPFIAELVNTLSNTVFVLLATYAIHSATKNKLETRFILIGFGFALVGVGSWLFHMTLKYEFQLLDELPMIYATCIPMWSVISEGQTTRSSVAIGFGVLVGAQLLTAIYLYFKNPTIHQVAYALLNILIVYKSVLLTNDKVKEPRAKANLFKTMISGISTFLLGYFLWNMDVHFCNSWISLRRNIGMPYGFFFELHGWWHVLTGTGVYYYLVYLEYLRLFLIGREGEYEFIQHFGFLPEVKLKKRKRI